MILLMVSIRNVVFNSCLVSKSDHIDRVKLSIDLKKNHLQPTVNLKKKNVLLILMLQNLNC